MDKTTIRFSLFWLAATLLSAAPSTAQKPDVCLKIGGNYFINCARTIAFGDYSILSVSGDEKTGRMVNFEIYSAKGTLDATLKEGKFSGKNADSYSLKSLGDGFVISDSRTNRPVLKIQNVENKALKRMEMNVWADFFLPNGGRFECTPQTSNVPMLEMMKGATFKNNGTAIQL